MAPTLPFNPLATAAQREVEAQALGLFASPPVQQAIDRSRALFMADPRAATPAGRATIEQNLNEWAFSASTCAASMQPARPCVCWTLNLPHRWFGLDVPGSRHGVDNPDNLYRVIAVDARSHYELRGPRAGVSRPRREFHGVQRLPRQRRGLAFARRADAGRSRSRRRGALHARSRPGRPRGAPQPPAGEGGRRAAVRARLVARLGTRVADRARSASLVGSSCDRPRR
jgi:hypothetical protein